MNLVTQRTISTHKDLHWNCQARPSSRRVHLAETGEMMPCNAMTSLLHFCSCYSIVQGLGLEQRGRRVNLIHLICTHIEVFKSSIIPSLSELWWVNSCISDLYNSLPLCGLLHILTEGKAWYQYFNE